MYRTCIAVVDASRARMFIHERTAGPEGVREELSEVQDLVNPARRLRMSKLFSEARPGSGRTGGLHYGYDDHREEHLDAMDAEFARDIVGSIGTQLQDHPCQRLILCASPRMLGELRTKLGELPLLPIDEVPRDLVKLTPAKLRSQLESYGLLPARAA
jgi:protein required for attachment to host cells